MAKDVLSAIVTDIRGKIGTSVFCRGRSGNTVRIRVHGRNPRTALQTGVRSNLAKASVAFKGLNTTQWVSWNAYALTITKHNNVTGKAYNPVAIDAFTALASKFLQITPAGTIPLTPPAAAFAGDTITATSTGGTGQATFTGSAANTSGVKTELLLQPLKSKNRVPGVRGYRSKGFIAFAAGSLTSNVTVPAGTYVLAYRFVSTATGQQTRLVVLAAIPVS